MGCLSPAKNKTIIYIDIIDQIYTESEKINF
jgi:hypothetical protein